MVISVFRRREIGQPFLALAAVSWNAASAAPGTVAGTSRWTFVTVKPASARALILASAYVARPSPSRRQNVSFGFRSMFGRIVQNLGRIRQRFAHSRTLRWYRA